MSRFLLLSMHVLTACVPSESNLDFTTKWRLQAFNVIDTLWTQKLNSYGCYISVLPLLFLFKIMEESCDINGTFCTKALTHKVRNPGSIFSKPERVPVYMFSPLSLSVQLRYLLFFFWLQLCHCTDNARLMGPEKGRMIKGLFPRHLSIFCLLIILMWN